MGCLDVILLMGLDQGGLVLAPLAGPTNAHVLDMVAARERVVSHDGSHVLVVVEQAVVVQARLVGVILLVDAQHFHFLATYSVSELK